MIVWRRVLHLGSLNSSGSAKGAVDWPGGLKAGTVLRVVDGRS